MNKNNNFKYNYKILAQERKKQKISLENIASELTLNIDQVKSLENNLLHGFATPHFKNLALKRYCNFLAIDLEKVIPEEISTKEEINEEEIEEIYIDNNKFSFLSKLKKIPSHFFLILSCLILISKLDEKSFFKKKVGISDIKFAFPHLSPRPLMVP